MNDIVMGMNLMDTYVSQSVDDVEDATLGNLNLTKVNVFKTLDDLPQSLTGTIEQNTGVDKSLGKLVGFTEQLDTLNSSLYGMNISTTQLDGLNIALHKVLTNSSERLAVLVNKSECKQSAECDDLKYKLDLVRVTSSYANLSDVSDAQALVEAALIANVPELANAGYRSLQNITKNVEDATSDEIVLIKQKIDDVEEAVEDYYNDFKSYMGNVDLSGPANSIRNAEKDAQFVGNIASISLVCLTVIQIVAALLFFLGAIFGLCCRPVTSSSKNCDCNSQQASRTLMAGTIVTFIFFWLFMVIVVALFVGGGVLENMMCRHLVTFDETTETLERLTAKQYNVNLNLTIEELLTNCKKDQALYTAMKLDQFGYNITDYLNLDRYGMNEAINDMKNTSFDIGHVTLIDPIVNASVLMLYSALIDIDYDAYKQIVDNSITDTDILAYSLSVREAAGVLSDGTLKTDLYAEAATLNWTHENLIKPMQSLMENLKSSVNNASTISEETSLDVVMSDLVLAEEKINADGNTMLSDTLIISADSVMEELTNMSSTIDKVIRTDTANCYPVYESVQKIIIGPCVYMLSPINAIWFCYGWYLVLALITLFFAVNLASIYKKEYPEKVSRVGPEPPISEQMLYPNEDEPPFALDYSSKSNIYVSEPPIDIQMRNSPVSELPIKMREVPEKSYITDHVLYSTSNW